VPRLTRLEMAAGLRAETARLLGCRPGWRSFAGARSRPP
jgi:hypothetical protein